MAKRTGELDMSNQGLFLKTFRQRKGGGGVKEAGLTEMSNQGLFLKTFRQRKGGGGG